MSKHHYRHRPNPPPIRTITLATLTVLALALTPGVAAADEIRDGQWYLDTLGINEAHQLSQGAGVTIGVIDTGINADHPDLKGKVTAMNGDGSQDLSDHLDHGTRVASVLVGNNDGSGVLGVAPAASIITVNVFPAESPKGDVDMIVDAIRQLTDQGVDIITMSIGGGGPAGANAAIRYANENGVPVVVGTGNKIQDTGFGPEEQSGSGWGSSPGTIPVTGTDQNNQFWDNSLDLSLAAPQPQLGLSAPAVNIPVATADGGYTTRDGISYAAPIVAGTLALIKSAYPDLDYQTLIARLIETVQDRGPEGYDDKYGWGIVNPLAALTEDVVFDDDYSSVESYADDRLPLEEQGQQSDDSTEPNGDQDPSGESSHDQALTGSDTGTPLWMPITITAAALLAAAVILTLILRKKRHRANLTPPHPPTQPGPAAPQYQSPPHP